MVLDTLCRAELEKLVDQGLIVLIEGDEPHVEIETTRPDGAYHRGESRLGHPVLPAGYRRLSRTKPCPKMCLG